MLEESLHSQYIKFVHFQKITNIYLIIPQRRHSPLIAKIRTYPLKKDLINTERKKYKAIKDITEAVEHLRQKRIVHRDIKL